MSLTAPHWLAKDLSAQKAFLLCFLVCFAVLFRLQQLVRQAVGLPVAIGHALLANLTPLAHQSLMTPRLGFITTFSFWRTLS